MNFKQYMTAIEKQLDSITGQQTRNWILTQARIVDEDRRQNFLDNLERTEAIVGGGYRNSYHKAAELIVVFGGILEENGELGAMRRLVDHYKQIHSRKRAFRTKIDELSQRAR